MHTVNPGVGPRPEVTVIIPTRNRWRFLCANSLPSALQQEDVELEVIVVDDASSDDTSVRLGELPEPRLRVIRHPTPGGLARSRNTGISAARGEWVAFLDDDDLWSPRKLRRQIDTATGASASFAYSGVAIVDANGDAIGIDPPPDPATLRSGLLRGEPIPAGGSNVLARTTLLRRAGGFDERFVHLADYDCWIKLDIRGRGASCDDIHVGYLQHPGNMHLWNTRALVRDISYLNEMYAQRRGPYNFDAGRFLDWIANQHRAEGRRVQAARVHLIGSLKDRHLGHLRSAAGALIGKRRSSYAMSSRGSPRGHADSDHRRQEGCTSEPIWLSLYRAERRLARVDGLHHRS